MPVKEAEATNSLVDQGVDVLTCHVDQPEGDRRDRPSGAASSSAATTPTRPRWRPRATSPAPSGTGAPSTATTSSGCRPARRYPQLRARRLEGRLRQDVALRHGGVRRGEEEGRRRQGEDHGRATSSIFKGPLKDNTGKVGHPGRAADAKQTDIELEKMNYLVEGVVGSTHERRMRCVTSAPARRCAPDRLRRSPRRGLRSDAGARRRRGDARSPSALRSAALLLFGVFVALAGAQPAGGLSQMFRGAFGTWFSLAEHPAAGGAADADGAVRRRCRAPRAGHHRRRGRAGAGRPRRRGGRRSLSAPPLSIKAAMPLAGALVGGALDGAGRTLRAVPRRQRDHQQPAARPTSRSRCSTTWSKGRCAIPRA